jgi:hypothetical protein
LAPPAKIEGVRDKPVNAEDLVELTYHNPKTFKAMLSVFKAYSATDVNILFWRDKVEMRAVSHDNRALVTTTINGECAGFYYCGEPTQISVKHEHISRVLGTLSGAGKLSIVFERNRRHCLLLKLEDTEYNLSDNYEITLNSACEQLEMVEDDSDYPVKFELNSKLFKGKVTDFSRMAKTLTITKTSDKPLQMSFDEDKSVNYLGIYFDDERIKLQADIPADEIFAVSVPIKDIKSFMTSGIGETVTIAAEKNKRLSLTSHIDDTVNGFAVQIKAYIDIIKYG